MRVWAVFLLFLSFLFCDKSATVHFSEFVKTDFSQHDLIYKEPVTRWDEALPLGNGLMGVLVWGDGNPLKLSLDRADLWDLRPVKEWESPDYSYQVMRQWVKEGRKDDLYNLYEKPYSKNAGPTKIPAARIQITVPSAKVSTSRLALSSASANVKFDDGTVVDVFQHADEAFGLIRILPGQNFPEFELVVPAFYKKSSETESKNALDTGDLGLLGYPAPTLLDDENFYAFEQEGWGGFRYAVSLEWKKEKDYIIAAWSIATTNESDNPLKLARQRTQTALDKGFKKNFDEHKKWWKSFWQESRITVPDKTVERQWYLDTYKFGSAARHNTPPITLQAVWTADEGKIPPWKGDYHHDLNTQLSYWPCYSGNHLQEGLGYLDWLWETLPEAEMYTRNFFDKPGINVPMTADLRGRQIGGWHQYTHSATIAAWLAQHFYLHWRFSQDRQFLKERAYPYMRKSAVFLESMLEQDKNGKRYLPLSSSPEIFDNKLKAWLPPTSNYDLALSRWLFSAVAECADELELENDKVYWENILQECPELALANDDNRLLVAPDLELPFSHRHFSHLMAIHPLGLVRWENGPKDQQIIKASLDELDRMGTDYWTGYSFAWLASLAARARDGEKAEKALKIFSKAFCSKNSFHLNGDQTKSGYSKFTYRPFTLEGNMAAAAGLQEMLLQSYSGTVRLFPAVPASWKNAGFYQLRAEGAFLVSAQKKDGHVIRVAIQSEKGGLLKLEKPEHPIHWHLNKVKIVSQTDDEIVFDCRPGGLINGY